VAQSDRLRRVRGGGLLTSHIPFRELDQHMECPLPNRRRSRLRMNESERVSPRGGGAALFVLIGLHACGVSPPDYTSDQDDAEVYADIAAVARRALDISGPMHVHPYLAVVTDDPGSRPADLTTFEYEPSAALELLGRADSTLVLCQVDAQGMCAESYVVLSQIKRLGDRDAVAVVRSIRGRSTLMLAVRLRYGREGWRVSGSKLIP
jgi:hypothetical protein